MPYRIYPLGDHALVIDWGNRIDEKINRQVLSVYDRLRRATLPGVNDIVPAYSSLALLFERCASPGPSPDYSPFDTTQRLLEQILSEPVQITELPGRRIDIPVCYDLSLAPDLENLSGRTGMPVEQVVQLHTEPEYRVYMVGFLPGFAYLGSVPASIATPRLAQPRTRVPAGSVGIAGEQTGIYPLESPGGWNLIGRTPLKMFDPARENPTLLLPGDRVRFFPISLEQFGQMQSGS